MTGRTPPRPPANPRPKPRLDEPFDANADANRILALFAGMAALAGPRRTRPLAGFIYGAYLSRVQGAGRDRVVREIGRTIERLFAEKTSVGARLDALEPRVADVETWISSAKRKPSEPPAVILGRIVDRVADADDDCGAGGA